MKKCTRCGKEYPDDAEACALDHAPLASKPPTSNADLAVERSNPGGSTQTEDGVEIPEGFRPFGCFDPFVASGLLEKFEQAGIQFLIDRIEKPVPTGRGIRKLHLIQIHVQQADGKRAVEILSRDWMV